MRLFHLLFPSASRWIYLLAFCIGGISTLAFAPHHLWWVQILTMGWLLYITSPLFSPQGHKRAMLTALSYGSGHAIFGVYWLFISMHTYGGLPAPMAGLALFLLSLALGLLTLATICTARMLQTRWPVSVSAYFIGIAPAIWAIIDWCQGWVLTGFPWIVPGYAHSVGPFTGIAPIFGVYGLSWLSALLAGLLVALCISHKKTRLSIAGLTLIVVAAGVSTRFLVWTTPTGNPITVRLLQGNIPQDTKFTREAIIDALLRYERLIEAQPADVIVTPETAIPLLPKQLPPDYTNALTTFAHETNSYLALGMLHQNAQGDYGNSIFGIDPVLKNSLSAPDNVYRYDKHHLVPLGEFIPWGFQWFVDMMDIPLGDMVRGPAVQPPFPVKDQWILPNICYEDLFGEEIARQLAAQANTNMPQASILLNVSNIAWFGDSSALPQHLQISQMRALETGRPMLRSTNTGTTAVIDPRGHIVSQLPAYTSDALSASVQGYQGLTPYIRWGNAGIITGLFILLGCIYLCSRQSFYKRLS